MGASSPDVRGFEVTWPGITSLPRYLLTVSRVLSFAGGMPGGGRPGLLQR